MFKSKKLFKKQQVALLLKCKQLAIYYNGRL